MYYNEIDEFCAAWLRELMKAGQIPDGEVDTRSIADVQPDDLRGFHQCHFFAGIGGWAYALRLAGWPDDREVWTGSCPCQPWSVAGQGKGSDDPRDLWPIWRELIEQFSPATVFGEQVTSRDGLLWLDRVYFDLEEEGFAIGAADLCAAGAGAPHIRQRIYFVADASGERRQQNPGSTPRNESENGRQSHSDHVLTSADQGNRAGMVHAYSGHGFWWSGALQVGRNAIEAEIERGGRRYRAQWRVKPGVSLLAHGVSRRVERLSGFGNAIVPQVAQVFIEAYLACCS